MLSLFSNRPSSITLREFARTIGAAIHTDSQTQNRWVTAEIGNLAVRGGHCYLELIEKNETGQTVAKLRGTIWAGVYVKLKNKFESTTEQQFAAGLKVMILGSASFHEVFGISININDIDPTYTLGDLIRIRREILAALTQEGVIEFNRSLAQPDVPQRIAVISSEKAAGFEDFMNQLQNNRYGFIYYPVLFNAVMQGSRTPSTIIEALQRIELSTDLWDCVVIIRGGGATGDLMDFDNMELARAIATFPLPIIVGIGHERDRTVLDEIACVRVKTPTAAAEWILGRTLEYATRIRQLADFVITESERRLAGATQQIARMESLIPALARGRLDKAAAILHHHSSAIPILWKNRISREHQRLKFQYGMLRQSAISVITNSQNNIGLLTMRFTENITTMVRRNTEHLSHLEEMIATLTPENTLRRGYSITRIAGKAVTDASHIQPGAMLETTLLHGCIVSYAEPQSIEKK